MTLFVNIEKQLNPSLPPRLRPPPPFFLFSLSLLKIAMRRELLISVFASLVLSSSRCLGLDMSGVVHRRLSRGSPSPWSIKRRERVRAGKGGEGVSSSKFLLHSRRVGGKQGGSAEPESVPKGRRVSAGSVLGRSAALLACLVPFKCSATAMSLAGGKGAAASALGNTGKLAMSGLWVGLFLMLGLFHAAEIAITTLYPWKVREFAEEEGEGSPFTTLNQDITRVLTTILVTSTAMSIYATTIFTRLASSIFGVRGERYGALSLTFLTLFFVELLPKSVGVSNAELVARKMVPPINVISSVFSPVGIFLTSCAKKCLRLFGFKETSMDLVSEEVSDPREKKQQQQQQQKLENI